MMCKTGKLFLIFGMIICIIFVTGCGGGSSKPKSPVVMDIEFEDSYSLDDPIIVLVKFGHLFSNNFSKDTLGVFSMYHHGSSTGSVPKELRNGEQFFEVEDIFTTKYHVSRDRENRVYNNYIEVTIPKKYIINESGRIRIELIGYRLDADGNILEHNWYGISTIIKYTVVENLVYFEIYGYTGL